MTDGSWTARPWRQQEQLLTITRQKILRHARDRLERAGQRGRRAPTGAGAVTRPVCRSRAIGAVRVLCYAKPDPTGCSGLQRRADVIEADAGAAHPNPTSRSACLDLGP